MGEEYAFTNFVFLFRVRHSCLVLVCDNKEQHQLARGGTRMGLSGGGMLRVFVLLCGFMFHTSASGS